MPRGLARCFFHAEDTLTDTSEHVPVTLILYLHKYNLFTMHSHSNKRLERMQLLQNCYMKTKFADVVTPTPAGFAAIGELHPGQVAGLLQHILNA